MPQQRRKTLRKVEVDPDNPNHFAKRPPRKGKEDAKIACSGPNALHYDYEVKCMKENADKILSPMT